MIVNKNVVTGMMVLTAWAVYNVPCAQARPGIDGYYVEDTNLKFYVLRDVFKEAEEKFNCVFNCSYRDCNSAWTNGCGKAYLCSYGEVHSPDHCLWRRWDKFNEKGVLIESKKGDMYEEIQWVVTRSKELIDERLKLQQQKRQELQKASRARVEDWIKQMTGCELGQGPIKDVEITHGTQRIPLKKKFRYFSDCQLVYLQGKFYKLELSVTFDEKYSQQAIYKERTDCFNNLMTELELPTSRATFWEEADLYIHSDTKNHGVILEIMDNKIHHDYWEAKRNTGDNLPELDSQELAPEREQRARVEEKAKSEGMARLAAEKDAQREAARAKEHAQREREREEQRAQLKQIQDELKKAREERERAKAESAQPR